MPHRIIAAAATVAFGIMAGQAAAQTYTFKTLDINKSDETVLVDITQYSILGWDQPPAGNPTCYIITGTSKVPLADPKGVATYCQGINASGVVVGYYENSANVAIGFTYANGVFNDFSLSNGAPFPLPLGISDTGAITGYYYDVHNNPTGFILKSTGALTTFRIPGMTNLFPIGINKTYQVTIQAFDTGGNLHAFLRRASSLTELAYPGATLTAVSKINNLGQAVGTYVDNAGGHHGFVFDSATAVYYSIDYPGMASTALNGINQRQTLVGDFRRTNGSPREGLRAVGSLP